MKFLTPREVQDFPPPEWILDGYIQTNSTILLFGPPDVGKSFLLLDMLCTIHTGQPGIFKPLLQGPILLVVGEGLGGIGLRFDAWENSRKVTLAPDGQFQLLGQPVQLHDKKVRTQFIKAVEDLFGERRPLLIAYDTMARCSVGLDENSAKDMGELVHGMEEIRQEFGCSQMLVHHSTKANPEVERGSGALFGGVDTTFVLRMKAKNNNLVRTLTCRKQKNGHKSKELDVLLKECAPSMVYSLHEQRKEETRATQLRDVFQGLRDKVMLPKVTFLKDAFPPTYFDPEGRVLAVTSVGSRVMVEVVDGDDAMYRAWLKSDRRLRQADRSDHASAGPFAYISYSDNQDEGVREAVRTQRFSEQGDPYPALSDLEMAWWVWGCAELGLPQADVCRWYGMNRGVLQRHVKTWRKYGLLPFKQEDG